MGQRSRRNYLLEYADDGFTPPDSWRPEALAKAEVKRLMVAAYTACVAAETPRRLGEDADSNDLAGDKWLSKGLANVYWTLWRRLMTARNAPLPPEELTEAEQILFPPEGWVVLHARAVGHEEARRAGRTVLWDRYWDDLYPRLIARRRALATFALSRDLFGWGYKIVAGIGNEIEWIEMKFDEFERRYAFADATR